MSKEYICSICNKNFEPIGHNAQPVNDGRCCTKCNYEVVLPERLKTIYDKVSENKDSENKRQQQ
jgi:DNA-directed RNA polymerase subunit RPC12/RpoP